MGENKKNNENINSEENTTKKEVLFDCERDKIDNPEKYRDDGKKVLYDAQEEIKNKEKENRKPYEINEDEQQNVFRDGLNGGQFIPRHSCPMCGFGKKSISELYTRSRFGRKKNSIGYSAICANCGFVSFYATDINKLLKYFRGKV